MRVWLLYIRTPLQCLEKSCSGIQPKQQTSWGPEMDSQVTIRTLRPLDVAQVKMFPPNKPGAPVFCNLPEHFIPAGTTGLSYMHVYKRPHDIICSGCVVSSACVRACGWVSIA